MTGKEVSHTGDTLKIGDEEVQLEKDILETLVYEDLVVVVLSFPGGSDVLTNVVAFDFAGSKQWTIDPVPEAYRSEGGDAYVGLYEGEDGELVVVSFREVCYEVDPETGAVEYLYSVR